MVSISSRLRRFTIYLSEYYRRVRGIGGKWWRWRVRCRISTRSGCYRSPRETCGHRKGFGRESSRRLTRNIRLWTYCVWSGDPCSHDECPGLRRAFCNPRPSSSRAPIVRPSNGICLPFTYVIKRMRPKLRKLYGSVLARSHFFFFS